jgi:hypothetical protein
MEDVAPYAEINVAKVPADGNIGGMIFAVGTMVIFFWGIPLLRYMFPAAIVLGCGIAGILHFVRHEPTGTPWILPAANQR